MKKPPSNEDGFFKDRLSLGGSANGANACASTAGDAGIGVDHELAFAFADSGNGALFCACAACNTVVIDYICHDKLPP